MHLVWVCGVFLNAQTDIKMQYDKYSSYLDVRSVCWFWFLYV